MILSGQIIERIQQEKFSQSSELSKKLEEAVTAQQEAEAKIAVLERQLREGGGIPTGIVRSFSAKFELLLYRKVYFTHVLKSVCATTTSILIFKLSCYETVLNYSVSSYSFILYYSIKVYNIDTMAV